jgi:sugar transferase (PEP-CTERM system associated)
MYRAGSSIYQAILVTGDFMLLLGSYLLAINYWWLKEGPQAEDFVFTAVFSVSVYLLALFTFDLYDVQTDYKGYQASTLTWVIGAVLAAGLGLAGLFYLMPYVKFPRGVFLIQMALAIPLLFLWRVNFWRVRQETLTPKRVLIIGATKAGQAAVEILRPFGSEYRVIGFVDDDPNKQSIKISEHAVLGTSHDLPGLVKRHKVNGIVVAVMRRIQKGLMQATLQCRMDGVFVSDLLTLGEELTGRILLEYIRESWFVFSPGFIILHHRMFQRIKRMTDLSCAVIGLLLGSPLVLLAAALIKVESPGPVFFRQTRVGEDEQLFTVFKLRTMTASCDEWAVYTEEHDARVTRVGRILRFLRIDEIPQMWNVVKGEMSFVGPRAEWDVLVKEYKEKIPYYSVRHVVRPGITGWSQVNYPYGSSVQDAFRKLEYDLYYVKNMSMALDLRILFKTVSVVLLGKGAR